MPYFTEKNATITAVLGPAGSQLAWPSTFKTFKTFDGGDPVAATSQLNPGNGIKAVALPGPETTTNVTISAPYSTDIDAKRQNINGYVNKTMSVSFTPKDGDGNNNGVTTTFTGIFKGPVWPKGDAGSGNAMMFSLVMECDS